MGGGRTFSFLHYSDHEIAGCRFGRVVVGGRRRCARHGGRDILGSHLSEVADRGRSIERRLVAFGLLVGGIALLGTVTATLASWLVELVGAEREQADDLHALVRRLEAKVDQLAAERDRDPDAPTSP